MWLSEFLLNTLWSDITIQDLSTPLEALVAADKIAFPTAVARAEQIAKEFILGKQLFEVGSQTMTARSLMQRVYLQPGWFLCTWARFSLKISISHNTVQYIDF